MFPIIQIKSKNGLSDAEYALNHLKVNYEIKSVNETGLVTDCVVHVSNEEELGLLSRFVTFEVIFAKLKKIKMKKYPTESEDFITNEVIKQVNYIMETIYFFAITNVLVMEHLRVNASMNVDAFVLFNMNGFEDDLIIYNSFIEENFNSSEDLAEGGVLEGSLVTVLEEIKSEFLKGDNDLITEKSIDVFINKEKEIIIKKANGDIIDKSYIENLIDFKIEVSLDENDLLFKDLYDTVFVVFFSIIFLGVTEIVFHNDKNMEYRSFFRKELSSSLGVDYTYRLITCNGCNNC